MGKLTDVALRNWVRAGKPIAMTDGDGLTFTLSAKGTAAWVLRYRIDGVRKEITLGRYPDLTLTKARELAAEKRVAVFQGVDVAREKKERKEIVSKRRLYLRLTAIGGVMLHAIEKSKTRIPTRYLGDRDGIELRVSEEDEITSTVLGPLDFLTAAENHRFWQRLLASVKHANFLPPSQPSNVEFGFWERRIANDASGTIEPDAIVRMCWPDGSTRTLLIELKWRAPLSGEDQLHRQWLQYLTEMERQTALHLFIAPNVSAGESARSKSDVWGDRKLVLLSWLHIRSVLGEFSKETAAIGRWARVADQFLESVHIRKFRGFNTLFHEQVQLSEGLPSPLFWHA